MDLLFHSMIPGSNQGMHTGYKYMCGPVYGTWEPQPGWESGRLIRHACSPLYLYLQAPSWGSAYMHASRSILANTRGYLIVSFFVCVKSLYIFMCVFMKI